MNKDIRDKVSQIAGKKYNTLFIFIWITLALYVGTPILMGVFDTDEAVGVLAPLCGISGFAFIIITICYLTKIYPIKKSLKTLYKTNKLNYVDEITSGNYNSNGKIGVSAHLLYDKKTNMIVAFDDIIWIYKKKRDWFTFDVMFCTIDGKQYLSRIDDTTLNEFVKRRAGILLGFTPQNRVVYNAKVKEFKAKNDQ